MTVASEAAEAGTPSFAGRWLWRLLTLVAAGLILLVAPTVRSVLALQLTVALVGIVACGAVCLGNPALGGSALAAVTLALVGAALVLAALSAFASATRHALAR